MARRTESNRGLHNDIQSQPSRSALASDTTCLRICLWRCRFVMGVVWWIQVAQRCLSHLPCFASLSPQVDVDRLPLRCSLAAISHSQYTCTGGRYLPLEDSKEVCWHRCGANYDASDADMPHLNGIHYQNFYEWRWTNPIGHCILLLYGAKEFLQYEHSAAYYDDHAVLHDAQHIPHRLGSSSCYQGTIRGCFTSIPYRWNIRRYTSYGLHNLCRHSILQRYHRLVRSSSDELQLHESEPLA